MLTATAGEFTLRKFWAARSQPTFRTLAVERLEEGPVDVIFVGSSHIHTGIDPEEFPYSVVNLSDNVLDYRMAEILCHKYWNRVSKARLVVLELDAVPVQWDTVSHLKGNFTRPFQWKLGAEELELPPLESVKVWIFERFAVGRNARLWPTLIKPLTLDNAKTGPGFHALHGQVNSSEKAAYLDRLKVECKVEVAENNLTCLQSLLLDLHKAGVKVKLLRPPFHDEYWRHPGTIFRNQYAEMALDTFLRTPSTRPSDVIDIRYKFKSIDKYYWNWTHLNKLGAKALSEHLARIIDLEEM